MLRIDEDGWLLSEDCVRLHPTTHCDRRPDGTTIDLVVLHGISLPPYEFRTHCVESFFVGNLDVDRAPVLKSLEGVRVSSHFYIDRDGEVHQFVSTLDRAWHAGVSQFLGRVRCNDFSIGIELEGSDFVPYEAKQYDRLVELLSAIDARHHPAYILGHSDIAPGRKTDPGPYFDWYKLSLYADQFGRPSFVGAAARTQMAIRQGSGCIV